MRLSYVFAVTSIAYKNERRGVHGADKGHKIFREMQARMESRFMPEVPMLVVKVPEYYTSKLCPDPTCLLGPGGTRSELRSPKYIGSTNNACRACHCPACGTTYHRDAVGVENIFYALVHTLVFGWHPWAPRARLAAKAYVDASASLPQEDTVPVYHSGASKYHARRVVSHPPRSATAPGGFNQNKASAESSSVRPFTSGRTSPTHPGAQAAASP